MEKRKNNDYEILTSEGWSDFSGIGKTIQDSYKITFEDNSFITCTLNHKFFENGKYIKYSELKIGDSLSGKTIKNLEKTNKKEEMYDILGAEKNHHFTLSETGVESSNCAFVPKNMWNEFWTSTYPTISSGKESKLIMVSCVTKDTLVITDKGLRYVGDFVDNSKEGAYNVDEYKILGRNKFRSGRIMFNSGFAQTRKIYTSHTELECSLEHKLWACVQNKETGEYEHRWVKSEELSVGDYVAVQYGYNLWGNDDSLDIDIISYKINTDLAYFFGVFLTVGFCVGSTISINTKLDIRETLYNIGATNFGYKDNVYTIESENLRKILKYVGLLTNHKIIPKKLLSMSRSNMVALLQGIFDTRSTTKDLYRVEFYNTSRKLCAQIQVILLNFGIRSELRSKSKFTNRKTIVEKEKLLKMVVKDFESKATLYYVDIRTINSFVFYKLIGYRYNKNQEHLKDIQKIIKLYIDYDKVPHARDIVKKCGVPKHKIIDGVDKTLYEHRTANISNYRLLRDKEIYLKYTKRNKGEFIKFYEENVDKNIFWSKIRKIEESENYVYDFSLDNTDNSVFSHSVIYNGIIGHQTPNGHNHFYDFWENAIRGRSDMVPVEVNWWDVPGRDEEWHQKILKNMSDEQFEVEYGNSFSSSSNTLIPSYVFKRLQNRIKTPIEHANHISIYKNPEKNHKYILSCDPSSVGKDFSAFHVIDITQFPYEQVCVFYQNDISHLSLPQIIYQIAKRYNDADVLIESNEIGSTILHILNYEIEYENVIKTFASSGRNEPILGQRTTAKSKALGCQELKTLIVDEGLLIYNEDTLNELRNFVLHNTSYAAVNGEHDDLCMALVIFAFYVSSPRFKMVNEKNYVDEYRERADKEIIEMLQPIPMTSNNIYDED